MMTLLVCLAVRVIDGDTIACNGQSLRFARINAPELSDPGGQTAKDWMRLKVEGKQVTCVVSNRREKYGRLLGDCFVGPGPSLSDQLLEAGMATPYRRGR